MVLKAASTLQCSVGELVPTQTVPTGTTASTSAGVL